VLKCGGPVADLSKSYERSNPTTSCGAGGGASGRGETQLAAVAITGAIGDLVIPVDDRSAVDDDLLLVHQV
jgi:hypothetical protein